MTTRDEVPKPSGPGSPGDGERHPLIEMQASIPLVLGRPPGRGARWPPRLLRTQFGRTLRRMEDENYTQISFRVFNIGAANKLPAYSMELGVPVRDDVHLRCVDRIIEIAAECAPDAEAVPHLADRAALRRAVAGVRVDDARVGRR